MVAEGAESVMVLSVDVVGDGTADGHELCARHDRQCPSPGNEQSLNVSQQNAGFAMQQAGRIVKADEAIEPGHLPEHAARIQAGVPVAAAHTEGQSA